MVAFCPILIMPSYLLLNVLNSNNKFLKKGLLSDQLFFMLVEDTPLIPKRSGAFEN